jgi:hypothetical protein
MSSLRKAQSLVPLLSTKPCFGFQIYSYSDSQHLLLPPKNRDSKL